MPPRAFSRHLFCEATVDDEGDLVLNEPEAFDFVDLPDNRTHVVAEGDTLWSLAEAYFEGIDRAEGLWWVIADFQPDPIVDPTIKLEAGSVLVIPSLRTVTERLFNEARRAEDQRA